jgi:hypothetical protein
VSAYSVVVSAESRMYSNELYVLAPQQGGHQIAHVVVQPMQWGGQPTATCARVQFNVGAQNDFRSPMSEYPQTPASLHKIPIYVQSKFPYPLQADCSIGPTGYSKGEQGSNAGPSQTWQTCTTSPDSARRLKLSEREKK